MTTPKRLPRRLRELLRARNDETMTNALHSRVHVASFDRTHRAWIPPDPPRRWFEAQGIEKAPVTRSSFWAKLRG